MPGHIFLAVTNYTAITELREDSFAQVLCTELPERINKLGVLLTNAVLVLLTLFYLVWFVHSVQTEDFLNYKDTTQTLLLAMFRLCILYLFGKEGYSVVSGAVTHTSH